MLFRFYKGCSHFNITQPFAGGGLGSLAAQLTVSLSVSKKWGGEAMSHPQKYAVLEQERQKRLETERVLVESKER